MEWVENACDPIVSTGLSENILKKTNRQMMLFKGKAIAVNKNCKKQNPKVSKIYISLCLACKIPRRILRGSPRKNVWHNFSTFADFLIIVQFWFFWFHPRSFKRPIYDSVYSYLSRYNPLYGSHCGFWKREFNWSKLH